MDNKKLELHSFFNFFLSNVEPKDLVANLIGGQLFIGLFKQSKCDLFYESRRAQEKFEGVNGSLDGRLKVINCR